jgi:hypothetical protein
MDLGGKGADARPSENGGPHDQVAGKGCVEASGRLGNRSDRSHVGGDVPIELRVRQLRERLDLETLVGIFDVDRQEAVDVRVVDLHAVQLDHAVLAEQMDLVPESGQRRGQVGAVDVAAGAAQHVAVEEQDPHRFRASY